MLMQMHYQFKDGKTEFVAQRDVENLKEMQFWVKELWKTHAPPENAIWMACNEKSEFFIKTSAQNNKSFKADS